MSLEHTRHNRRALLAGLAAAGLGAAIAPRLVAAQDGTPVAQATPIDTAALPLKTAGKLVVHADQPLYEPWFIDNDPTTGKGFESALVYAIAAELGLKPEDVEWGYTAFNASYAPGPKDFDFYLTEVSITEPRKQAVSFSDGYYSTPFVIIAPDDSPVKDAKTLEDLRKYKFGTLVNSSYATYITDVIKPEQEQSVFNTNAEAIQALANGQVDANVESLQIAIEVTTDQFPNLDIVGILPGPGTELGIVFEKDSPLVPFINQALYNLKANGTWQKLVDEWLPKDPEFPHIAE
ncbi:MAG: ABC transporter substrate-binding protein [Thermomicrobiales bacterium]